MTTISSGLRVPVLASLFAAALAGGASSALLGLCGPFTDAAADAFCPFVLEVFYLGITTGTTPTTYDPTADVTRLQMAAFLSRTVDGTLRRASRRAAANKFWIPGSGAALGLTTVGASSYGVAFDGADLWVGNQGGTVSRVRASDGRLLETWTGATDANQILVALGNSLGHSVSLWKAADLSVLGSRLTGPGSTPAAATSDGLIFWITLATAQKLARF